MKHGRAIIPVEFVADPLSGINVVFRCDRRRVPMKASGLSRNGTVVSQRTVLDAEGRAWLSRALNEFRDNPCWEWPMSLSLIRATLFGVPGFREEKNAATDEAANED